MTKSELIGMLEDVPDDYEIVINDGGLLKDLTMEADDSNKLLVIGIVDNWL